jgi:hypothetical protein
MLLREIIRGQLQLEVSIEEKFNIISESLKEQKPAPDFNNNKEKKAKTDAFKVCCFIYLFIVIIFFHSNYN